MKSKYTLLIVFYLLLSLSDAYAQRQGRMRGTVKDSDGKAIEHADIIIEN